MCAIDCYPLSQFKGADFAKEFTTDDRCYVLKRQIRHGSHSPLGVVVRNGAGLQIVLVGEQIANGGYHQDINAAIAQLMTERSKSKRQAVRKQIEA